MQPTAFDGADLLINYNTRVAFLRFFCHSTGVVYARRPRSSLKRSHALLFLYEHPALDSRHARLPAVSNIIIRVSQPLSCGAKKDRALKHIIIASLIGVQRTGLSGTCAKHQAAATASSRCSGSLVEGAAETPFSLIAGMAGAEGGGCTAGPGQARRQLCPSLLSQRWCGHW